MPDKKSDYTTMTEEELTVEHQRLESQRQAIKAEMVAIARELGNRQVKRDSERAIERAASGQGWTSGGKVALETVDADGQPQMTLLGSDEPRSLADHVAAHIDKFWNKNTEEKRNA